MKKPLFPRFLSSNRPRDKLVTYYLYCYDLRQQALDRLVGRVSFASGESMEFTDPQD